MKIFETEIETFKKKYLSLCVSVIKSIKILQTIEVWVCVAESVPQLTFNEVIMEPLLRVNSN